MIPTISTSYGRRYAGPSYSLQSALDTDLAGLADRLDRLADHHLSFGDPTVADRLTWRAHAVRGLASALSSHPSLAREAQ